MTLLGEILAFSLLAFWLLLFSLQWVAQAIGAWLGRRRVAGGAAPAEGVGVVVGGMLGLLAFVLALTLSFATTRFEERRQGTLMEANALGTAWLRAKAIGHPRGEDCPLTDDCSLVDSTVSANHDLVLDDDRHGPDRFQHSANLRRRADVATLADLRAGSNQRV